MNKTQLEELVLLHTRMGSDFFTTRYGRMNPQAILITQRGHEHIIGVEGKALRGTQMADVLAAFARSIGGAEAVLVQADIRFKWVPPDTVKQVRRDMVYTGGSIANDPANPEAFITAGRSRGNTATSIRRYTRTHSPEGDVIVFTDPVALKADHDHADLFILPDLWGN